MKKVIQDVLGKFGYRLTKIRKPQPTKPKRHPNIDVLDLVIKDYLKDSNKEFNFMQIGAHDGEWCDPINSYIKQYHWSGLLLNRNQMHSKNS